MFKRFFKGDQLERNILILGEPGCGKRSFLLHYKDGDVASQNHSLPEINRLTYNKKLDNKSVSLVFTLNQTSDAMIPSLEKPTNYDLIISLTDLSSDKAEANMLHQARIIETHYPGVKSICVGTKEDQISGPHFSDRGDIIACSAKTGSGFDKFEEAFLKSLKLDDELKESHGYSCS